MVTIFIAFIGVVAGVWFSREVIRDSLVISISDEEVQLRKNGSMKTISRDDITSIFLDNKKLVILGKKS